VDGRVGGMSRANRVSSYSDANRPVPPDRATNPNSPPRLHCTPPARPQQAIDDRRCLPRAVTSLQNLHLRSEMTTELCDDPLLRCYFEKDARVSDMAASPLRRVRARFGLGRIPGGLSVVPRRKPGRCPLCMFPGGEAKESCSEQLQAGPFDAGTLLSITP